MIGCEQRDDYDNPAYKEALMVFMRNFLCREWPFPPEVMKAIQDLSEDRTVQVMMYAVSNYHWLLLTTFNEVSLIHHLRNGPSPFLINGSTKDWTVVPRLHQSTSRRWSTMVSMTRRTV